MFIPRSFSKDLLVTQPGSSLTFLSISDWKTFTTSLINKDWGREAELLSSDGLSASRVDLGLWSVSEDSFLGQNSGGSKLTTSWIASAKEMVTSSSSSESEEPLSIKCFLANLDEALWGEPALLSPSSSLLSTLMERLSSLSELEGKALARSLWRGPEECLRLLWFLETEEGRRLWAFFFLWRLCLSEEVDQSELI